MRFYLIWILSDIVPVYIKHTLNISRRLHVSTLHDYIKSTPKDAILTVGMIFKKNWPYTKLFNFHLLQIRESGMLDHILHKYKKNIKTTCPNEQRISIVLKKFTPVGMEKTIFLYILISLGLFFSSVVLISELYIMNEYGK